MREQKRVKSVLHDLGGYDLSVMTRYGSELDGNTRLPQCNVGKGGRSSVSQTNAVSK